MGIKYLISTPLFDETSSLFLGHSTMINSLETGTLYEGANLFGRSLQHSATPESFFKQLSVRVISTAQLINDQVSCLVGVSIHAPDKSHCVYCGGIAP